MGSASFFAKELDLVDGIKLPATQSLDFTKKVFKKSRFFKPVLRLINPRLMATKPGSFKKKLDTAKFFISTENEF